jgi:hypothetical protein
MMIGHMYIPVAGLAQADHALEAFLAGRLRAFVSIPHGPREYFSSFLFIGGKFLHCTSRAVLHRSVWWGTRVTAC